MKICKTDADFLLDSFCFKDGVAFFYGKMHNGIIEYFVNDGQKVSGPFEVCPKTENSYIPRELEKLSVNAFEWYLPGKEHDEKSEERWHNTLEELRKIADDITVINKDARGLIVGYLHDLWRTCYIESLYAWKIYVPDSDDFYTKEQEKFEAELKRGHYDFEKIPGKTDKTKCLYFLPNITKDDLENFWDQFRNVYGYRAYQKKLTDEERQNELEVFLESKNLKKEFPLSLITLSENFRKRYSHKSPEQIMSEAKVYIRNASKHTGKERWLYRARMYHHPQAWELEEGLRNQYYEMWKKE